MKRDKKKNFFKCLQEEEEADYNNWRHFQKREAVDHPEEDGAGPETKVVFAFTLPLSRIPSRVPRRTSRTGGQTTP